MYLYLGQFYLVIFRTPTLCLVGGDENVGGDEERSVLSRRNHIVCFVPHSVEPVGHLPQSMLVTIISPFCNRESHIITHNHTMWFQCIFHSCWIYSWEGNGFKPVAALFHTGCCPLHLRRKSFNAKGQTGKQAEGQGGKQTNRQTDNWQTTNKLTIRQTTNQTNGLNFRPPSLTFVITLDSTGAASWKRFFYYCPYCLFWTYIDVYVETLFTPKNGGLSDWDGPQQQFRLHSQVFSPALS